MNRTIGTPRLWAILAAVFGLISLAVTVAFKLLGPVKAAGVCMGGGAVVQFEFAREAQDLTNIFGDVIDPCRAPTIAAMDAVNQLDVVAYIPSYTLFAIFAALFIGGGRLRLPILLAILAAAVALVADYVETFTLLEITPMLEERADLLPVSSTAAWIKFGALAAHALVLAAVCLEKPPRRWILGILLLAPAVGALAAFSDSRNMNLLTLGFLLAWLPLLGLAAWRAVRPVAVEVQ
ncbi:hypothetical protein [Caulobacter sp. NIBR1757]|uniref:hypothetical protein n=1 Tax=Caulobacter sp. NIBR1757 TaxID=3016000 RepID=UPI0022F04D68|nr:hypothetical protein [Caulobacter sp. NIBR1757]WGM39674.1 hypothetical protein AMEJIAPC_02599 [Caulobacter sp. NIBR1757]